MSEPYLCDRCMKREATPGFCAVCDEPLMDLRDEQVQELIRDQDRRRFFRRSAKFLFLGVMVNLPFTLFLFTLYVQFPFLPAHVALLAFGLILVGGSIIVERVGIHMFPPRQVSKELGDEALEAGETNLLHGASEVITNLFD